MTETHVRYVDLFDAAGVDLDGNGTCSPDERSIRDFLTSKGRLEKFLLERGHYWRGSALPEWVPEGTPGECYSDAAWLALNYPGEFTYVEGVAVGAGLIPVHHAWAVENATGKVVDKTWAALDFFRPTRTYYYGVPVKTDFLRAHLLEKEAYGLFHKDGGHVNSDLIEGGIVFNWIADYPGNLKNAA